MAKTAQVDKLKEERERIRQRHITLTQQNAPEMPQSYNGIQEKQMEVCEICGSFLIVGDAQVKWNGFIGDTQFDSLGESWRSSYG